MAGTNYLCKDCKNVFLSSKKPDGKWYEKPQCGKCGSRDLVVKKD